MISPLIQRIAEDIDDDKKTKDVEEIRKIIVKRIDKFCFLVIFSGKVQNSR